MTENFGTVYVPWFWKALPAFNSDPVIMQVATTIASECLLKLVQQSSDLLVLEDVSFEPSSYRTWARLLEGIASSDYWRTIKPEQVALDNLTVPTRFYDPVDGGILSDIKHSNNQCGEGALYKKGPRSSSVDTQPGRQKNSDEKVRGFEDPLKLKKENIKVEKNDSHPKQRSTSSVSTIDLSESSSDDASSSEDTTARDDHRSRSSQMAFYPRKEVVTPEMFEMNGWQTLKQFFQSYERYFDAKYVGTSRDSTRHLREFLPSPMREYYEALGGPKMKYEKIKAQLQSWYRRQERHGSRHWRNKLNEASMKPGEPLKVYALRLHEMSRKAYPNDDSLRTRELRHKFLESVPSDFARYVQLTQDAAKAAGQRSKLDWKTLLRLSEKEDERQRKTSSKSKSVPSDPQVWYSRPDTKAAHESCETGCSCSSQRVCASSQSPARNQMSPRQQTRTFTRSRNSHRDPAAKKQPCNWCGRLGHGENSCWERQGFCTRCGANDHQSEECPRKQQSQSKEKPVCPICRGPHLGRDCLN